MNNFFSLVSGVCFYFLLTSGAFAQKAVPELWGQRVHDEAHVLQQATVDQLEKNLRTYEDSTSNQIAILIVQSLDGDVIESYSIRVVEKWKLGQKGKDNGVLLLIAVDDHKMRIEVGQGLEGVLTDAQSSRIIRNEIAPAFRRNDYDAGVTAGIDAIIKAIGGEYKADETTVSDTTGIAIGILLGLFFLIVLVASFIKEFRSKKGERISPLSKQKPSRVKPKKGLGGIGTAVVPNIFSGSSSGSFFSSGGGFSGGGGSFGGGGSSGSW